MTDIQSGEALRDQGMARVKASNKQWFRDAKLIALAWLAARIGAEVTGEDITNAVTRYHPDKPTSPNVWGALTNALVRAGCIHPTGRQEPMKKPRSHARRTDMYRVTQL